MPRDEGAQSLGKRDDSLNEAKMPISIKCPKCQATGVVPDEALHAIATCPLCQTAFRIDAREWESQPGNLWVDPMTIAPDFSDLPTMPPPPYVAEHDQLEPAAPPPRPLPTPPEPKAVVSTEPVEPPHPDDTLGMAAWFRGERERFRQYVENELARLDNARQEKARAESRYEATYLIRSQELSRQGANLDTRRVALTTGEEELKRKEEALKAREQEFEQHTSRFAEREAAIAQLEAGRDKLEAEAAQLSALVSELRPVVESLKLSKMEAETIRAEIKAKQSALDRRLIEVGRSELAIQKRLTELDELEKTMQLELEAREAELERQRATLLEEVRSLRTRLPADPVTTPMPRSMVTAREILTPLGEFELPGDPVARDVVEAS